MCVCVCVCVCVCTFSICLFLRIENMFFYPLLFKCFVIREELDYPLLLSPTQGEHDLSVYGGEAGIFVH